MHLLDEFVVGERLKIEFVVRHWRCSRSMCSRRDPGVVRAIASRG
jgi:hypothetical protein